MKRISIIKKDSFPKGTIQYKPLSVKKKESTEVHDNELIANDYYKNQNTDNLDQNQNEIQTEPDIDIADNHRDSRDNNIGFKNSVADTVNNNPPDFYLPDDNPPDVDPPDVDPPGDNPPDVDPPDDPPDENSRDANLRGSSTQSEPEKDNKLDENNGKKSNSVKKEKIAPIETTKQNQENQKPEFNPKLREDSIHATDEKKIPEKRKGFISRAVASVKNLFNFTKKDPTGKLKHF
jgi:hypothetical protein